MSGADRRHHVSRFIVGPILILLFAGALWADHIKRMHLLLWAICGAFAAVGLLEFYALCARRGQRPAAVVGLGVLVLAFMMMPLAHPDRFRDVPPPPPGLWPETVLALLPWLLAGWVVVKLVVRAPDFSPVDAVLSLAGPAYVGAILLLPEFWDARVLLFLVATNKGSDIFAYIVGSLVGRHKMASRVSPGKTWEGAVAGLVAGTAGGVACTGGWVDLELIALAAAITMAAQMGDLVESAFKRWAEAKDSGAFLPGLGGALDVIDSFLVSIPAVYVYRLAVA